MQIRENKGKAKERRENLGFSLLHSLPPQFSLPRIMLIDMNSFFASVEQQANPFFRGKPLGVCASLHETSCLIAASKEAKALGIKTGTLTYKAKRICPKIILLQAEPEKYREVNRRIVKIFYDYTDKVEVYSIDEAFLDLNSNIEYRNSKQDSKRFEFQNFKHSDLFRASDLGFRISNPLLIGAQIKQRIKAEVGEWLTCSIGIAPNRFMAKLAADLEKPDGLSIVWRENLPEIYRHKQLTDLWGVARGWEKRLARLNITSPLQLLNYPVANLISMFGKPGYYLWQRVQGLEEDKIESSNFPSPLGEGGRPARRSLSEGGRPGEVKLILDETSPSPVPPMAGHPPPEGEEQRGKKQLPKSFGHSWVLNFRTTDKERLKIVILRLAEKAARRMRAENFVASGMYLSVTLVDGSYLRRSKKLNFCIDTGLELYQQALLIWKHWNFKQEVLHIAAGFTHLSVKTKQLQLFTDKREALAPVLDYINNKYGEFTIRSGLLTQTSDFAPDAIAFGK